MEPITVGSDILKSTPSSEHGGKSISTCICQSYMYTSTVDARKKVTFRFSATPVARMYGFRFVLVLSSNRLHGSY